METLRHRFEVGKWCCRLCDVFYPNERPSDMGECRLKPPVIDVKNVTRFPVVKNDKWCGRFTEITFYDGYKAGVPDDRS